MVISNFRSGYESAWRQVYRSQGVQILPLRMLSPRNLGIDCKKYSILFINMIDDSYFLQRMDLGECPKIHDLALRADYQQAKSSKDYFYDVEVSTSFSFDE